MYLNVRFGYTFLIGHRTENDAWSTKGECMMKKIRPVMMVLLIAVLASYLTACGSRDSKQPTASSGTPGTSASYSTETDQGAAANETENTDATSRSETDTTGEGVMDGIADDVRKGVEDIKRDIMDTTESESTAETQNR